MQEFNKYNGDTGKINATCIYDDTFKKHEVIYHLCTRMPNKENDD